jgi:hypothetical protein
VYIATKRLAHKLCDAKVTGIHCDVVEVTTSELFRELHPRKKLPKFVWLKVDGQPGKDDFGLAERRRLVVSKRAFQLLNLKHCDVAAFSSE